jgi:F-type H+-transporting ATPase subunit delta
VSVSIVGKRYAKALMELAGDGAVVPQMARDLRDFATSWEQSRELRAAFENPSVKQQNRSAILRDIAQQSGMNPQVRDLLLLLADRQRLRHVPEIADAFQGMAEARSGRVRAEITSATPLGAAYVSELERALRAVTGREVVIAQHVDASLIGGIVTRIGDQVFDGSIKSRLSELKGELLR